MKIRMPLLGLACSCMIFYTSCKEKKDTDSNSSGTDTSYSGKRADNTIDSVNACDFFVDQAESERMIKKYETEFHHKGLEKEVWIEKCVVHSIKAFLDANSGYDGIRFFWGIEQKLLGKSTVLMIVPTMPSTSRVPYERHSNQFGVTIPLNTCTPSNLKVNVRTTDLVKMINKFGMDYRGEITEGQRSSATLRQLSSSVWISRCKIDSINVVLQSPEIDGLMAISAAYYKDDFRRSQREDREFVVQSTLIFVPTENGQYAWKKVRPDDKWKDNGGYNHGELCPKICD